MESSTFKVVFPSLLLVAVIVEVITFICAVFFSAATTSTTTTTANVLRLRPRPPASRLAIGTVPLSPLIPNLVFQTWRSRNPATAPPRMAAALARLRAHNPHLSFHFFNDAECRAFIRGHFGDEVTAAFDLLRPGAYKADLWRYCVLYRMGGAYLDVKYTVPVQPPPLGLGDLIATGPHLVADVDARNIYNAVMVGEKGSDLLRRCISKVLENVASRFYGVDDLHVTGPRMMRDVITPAERASMVTMRHRSYRGTRRKVVQARAPSKPSKFVDIFQMYDKYYDDILCKAGGSAAATTRYPELWLKRSVYADP